MFRLIKFIFNTTLIVLAIVGFNAIGGDKYVNMVTTSVSNFMQEKANENAKKIGDFSNLHEEFQIDNTVNLFGYKAVIAEHKNSGQKMCIIDSGKKALLTKSDIKNDKELENKIASLLNKFKYQAISFQEIHVTGHGNLKVYGQTVPYARFEAKAKKLPFSEIGGIVASIKTSDGNEKLIISISERKKYSQLLTEEFYKNIKET